MPVPEFLFVVSRRYDLSLFSAIATIAPSGTPDLCIDYRRVPQRGSSSREFLDEVYAHLSERVYDSIDQADFWFGFDVHIQPKVIGIDLDAQLPSTPTTLRSTPYRIRVVNPS